jgi:hypothetical protein
VSKTLNITNKAVLEHLNKQANQSKYIEGLVLNDIDCIGRILTREEVIQLIKEYIGDKKINTIIDDCVVNSAKNLMSI